IEGLLIADSMHDQYGGVLRRPLAGKPVLIKPAQHLVWVGLKPPGAVLRIRFRGGVHRRGKIAMRTGVSTRLPADNKTGNGSGNPLNAESSRTRKGNYSVEATSGRVKRKIAPCPGSDRASI